MNTTGDTNECPICLGSIIASNYVTVSCCKKQFHTNCYIQCMQLKRMCPMCRAPIVDPNVPEDRIGTGAIVGVGVGAGAITGASARIMIPTINYDVEMGRLEHSERVINTMRYCRILVTGFFVGSFIFMFAHFTQFR